MHLRHLVCLLSVVSVAALESSGAWAQADQRAAAEALFEKGRALVEQGDYADACPKIAESERLDPGLGTMLWLADCYASNGQTASAWVGFNDAAEAAGRLHDRREKVARDKAAELEKRLSRLLIAVPAAAAIQGLELRRDGVILGQAEWQVPIPLDPGIHTVSASAPGRESWSSTIQIAPGPTTLAVTVPVLAEHAVEPPPLSQPSAPPAPAGADQPPASAGFWTGRRVGATSLMGAGVVGLAVGTVFSFTAKASYDKSNEGPCDVRNSCTQQGLDDRSSARTMAAVATVGVGVGAAALAAGAILFFTAPNASAPVAVVPVAAASRAGVTLLGRF
ncbi:MAG TPA: hypothetical protein VHV30_07945 [Polyangiaceae bacterium]|jgi:hypothetical protein|nr:hypothetical protein [Polyangiaceae bacterium]